ncbi:MAG: glutamate--tRNA ligase, partial [Cyanobacteria bacterium J06639_1]
MTVRVRIAPSPTGNLHIGTARTAVFNWLYARHHNGKMILRIEDTDRERSRPEFTRNIVAGLSWLGLDWQEGPYYQSERMERYNEVIQQLLDRGLAYRCYCTPAELDEMRAAQKAANKAPRYDNRHRNLTEDQRQAFEKEGRQPVIRFIIEEPKTVSWTDEVRGEIEWNTQDLGGDMVIAKADGQPLYNMAVVVDDIDMEITHVIRGEDHIGNTPKQILLYEALGKEPPVFAHSPLILNAEGRKLSKRDGATSVTEFEHLGLLPEALKNYLALLSWSPPDGEELFDFEKAASQFDFDRVTRAAARFDWDKLNWMNGQYIRQLAPNELVVRLKPFWVMAGLNVEAVPSPEWLENTAKLVGEGLGRLNETAAISRYLFEEDIPYAPGAIAQLRLEDAKQAIAAVAERAADIPSTDDPEALMGLLKTAIAEATKALGVKKGLVMKSLRAALTGDLRGPDL